MAIQKYGVAYLFASSALGAPSIPTVIIVLPLLALHLLLDLLLQAGQPGLHIFVVAELLRHVHCYWDRLLRPRTSCFRRNGWWVGTFGDK